MRKSALFLFAMSDDLKTEIETYCELRGIAPTTFGRLARLGGTFYPRLVSGGESLPRTVAKARRFMADNPPLEGGKG